MYLIIHTNRRINSLADIQYYLSLWLLYMLLHGVAWCNYTYWISYKFQQTIICISYLTLSMAYPKNNIAFSHTIQPSYKRSFSRRRFLLSLFDSAHSAYSWRSTFQRSLKHDWNVVQRPFSALPIATYPHMKCENREIDGSRTIP